MTLHCFVDTLIRVVIFGLVGFTVAMFVIILIHEISQVSKKALLWVSGSVAAVLAITYLIALARC